MARSGTDVTRARSDAVRKRKKTLLVEYRQLKKANAFIDKRFGEQDESLTEEEKAVARFQKERLRKARSSKFSLSEDLPQPEAGSLTHLGQPLALLDDFKDAVPAPDEDELDDDPGASALDAATVHALHFGGGTATGSATPDGRPKTRREVMQEVMLKSKLAKAEKRQQRDDDAAAVATLDERFTALQQASALKALKRAPKEPAPESSAPAASSPKSGHVGLQDEQGYDDAHAKLVRGGRARASERMPSAEEVLEQERRRLQTLEAAQKQRMTHEEVPKDSAVDTEAALPAGGYARRRALARQQLMDEAASDGEADEDAPVTARAQTTGESSDTDDDSDAPSAASDDEDDTPEGMTAAERARAKRAASDDPLQRGLRALTAKMLLERGLQPSARSLAELKAGGGDVDSADETDEDGSGDDGSAEAGTSSEDPEVPSGDRVRGQGRPGRDAGDGAVAEAAAVSSEGVQGAVPGGKADWSGCEGAGSDDRHEGPAVLLRPSGAKDAAVPSADVDTRGGEWMDLLEDNGALGLAVSAGPSSQAGRVRDLKEKLLQLVDSDGSEEGRDGDGGADTADDGLDAGGSADEDSYEQEDGTDDKHDTDDDIGAEGMTDEDLNAQGAADDPLLRLFRQAIELKRSGAVTGIGSGNLSVERAAGDCSNGAVASAVGVQTCSCSLKRQRGDAGDGATDVRSGQVTAGAAPEAKRGCQSGVAVAEGDASEDVPFTPSIPADVAAFSQMADGFSGAGVALLVERIRVVNAPVLRAEGCLQLQHLYGVVMQYFADVAGKRPLRQDVLDDLMPAVVAMTAEVPLYAATLARARLHAMFERFTNSLKKSGSAASGWPGARGLALMHLFSILFPISDRKHPVTTPLALLLGYLLSCCPPRQPADIASGLSVCSLLQRMAAAGARFAPEATPFLQALLYSAADMEKRPAQDQLLAGHMQIEQSWLHRAANVKEPQPLSFWATLSRDPQSDYYAGAKFKAAALCSTLALTRTQLEALQRMPYPGATAPALQALLLAVGAVAGSQGVPAGLRAMSRELVKDMKATIQACDSARQPRVCPALQRAVPIKMLNPKYEVEFNKYRDYDPDRERAEAKRYRRLAKKEGRALRREVAGDATFMGVVRRKEKVRAANARDKSQKRAIAFLEQQEADFKSGGQGGMNPHLKEKAKTR